MSSLFNSSEYYNKGQSNRRFLRRPPAPAAPGNPRVTSAGISTTNLDQYAWAEISLDPPSPPSWAGTLHYITAYQFVLTSTIGGQLRRRSWYLPDQGTGPYRMEQLVPGAGYQLIVCAYDYMGQAGASATLNFTAQADATAPHAPIITASALPGGGAQIALDAVNNEFDFASYELWRGRGYSAGSWGVTPGKVAVFVGGIFNDLAIPATEPDYFYYVKVLDLSGNAGVSNIAGPVSVVTTIPPVPAAPSLATAMAAAQADGSVNFSFPASNDINLAYYRIWRRTDTGSWILLDTMSALPSTGTVTYNDTRTVSGTRYHYSVAACNASGEDSGFNTAPDINATALDSTAPAPPSALVFNGGLGLIQINWTPSAASDIAFYSVRWRWATVGSLSWTTWSAPLLVTGSSYVIHGVVDPVTGLPFTREQLANNFQASISTVDRAGNSSSALIGTILYPQLMGYIPSDDSVPPAPLSILVPSPLPGDGTIPLSWTPPSAGDIYGYQVEQYDSIGQQWELLGVLKDSDPSTLKRYAAIGLEPYNFNQRQYRFRVRTIDMSGNISAVNLLENPGFESGLGNWTAAADSGAVTVAVSNTAQTRNNSAGAVKCNFAGRERQQAAVTTGATYTFSAYMAQDPDAPGGTPRIRLRWLDAGNAVLSMIESSALNAGGSYQRLTLSGIAPGGAVKSEVELTGDPAQTTKTFLWDDVQLEQSAAATPFGDGKTVLLSAVDTAGPQDYATLALSVTGSLGQLNLRWVNPTAVTAGAYDYINGVFEIWRKVTASSQPNLPVDTSFRKIAEVPASNDGSVSGYDDMDPLETINITAQYQLRGRDRFSNEGPVLNGGAYVQAQSKTLADYSVPAVDSTPPAQPDMTTAVAAAQPDGSVLFQFNGVSDTDTSGYVVYRRKTGSPSFDALATIKKTFGGVIHYYDGAVSLGQSYDYSASAFDHSGNESTYDLIHFKTAVSSDSRAPMTPILPVLAGGPGRISCSWQQPAGLPPADRYVLQFTTNNGTSWSASYMTAATAFDVLSLALTKAQLKSGFKFRVQAVSASAVSSIFLTSVLPVDGDLLNYVPADAAAPAAPAGLTATPGQDSDVVLAWNANTEPDLWGYRIERQCNAAGWESLTDISAAAARSYRDTGLEPFAYRGRMYDFRIWAIDNSGNLSAAANTVSGVHINDLTPPSQTTAQLNLAATPQLGAIRLDWVNGSGFTFIDCVYEIWRSSSAAQAGFSKIAEQLGSDDGSPNSWTDFSPSDTAPVTYYYNLKVYDRWGNTSAFLRLDGSGGFLPVAATSLTVSDINPPDAAPPARVTMNGATASAQDDGSIRVAWGNQYTKDLAGYSVYRRRAGRSESFVAVGTIPANPQVGENWFQYSQDFEMTSWGKLGGVVITPDAAIDPIGGHTADQVYFPASPGGSSWIGLSQNPACPINPGEWYTFSVWLWAATAIAVVIEAEVDPYTGSYVSSSQINLTTTPTRYSVSVQRSPATSGAGAVAIGILQPYGVSSPAKTFFAWGTQLERAPAPGSYLLTAGVGHTFETDGTNGVLYVDPNLVLGQAYDYTVSAVDRAGNDSGFDPSQFVTAIAGDVRTPQPPSGISGRGAVSRVDLTWSPSATLGVTQYFLEWSLDAGATYLNSATVLGTQFSIGMLNAQTSVWIQSNLRVRVSTVNRSGTGRSAPAAMPMLGSSDMVGYVPLDSTAPNPVTNLAAAVATNGDVIVSWTESTSTDVNHYVIESQCNGGSWRGETMVPAGTTSYRIGGISNTAQLPYVFRVTAVDYSNLFSSPALSNTITPGPTDTPPALPSGLTLTGFYNDTGLSTATANLTWTENTESDLAGYEVQYQKSDLSGLPSIAAIPKGSPFISLHGLLQGVSYNFQVRAYDLGGLRSNYTDTLAATSSATPGGSKPPAITSAQMHVSIVEAHVNTHYTETVTIDLSAYPKPADFQCFQLKGQRDNPAEGPLLGTHTASPIVRVFVGPVNSDGGYNEYLYLRVQNQAGAVSDLSPVITFSVPGGDGSPKGGGNPP